MSGFGAKVVDLTGDEPITSLDGRARPRASESAQEFARRVRPSETARSEVDWIQVECPSRSGRSSDEFASAAAINAIVEEYRAEHIENKPNHRVLAAVKQEVFKKVYSAAIKHNDVSGKWMMFVPPHRIDDVWEKVAVAVESGKLGFSAKVAPCQGIPASDGVLICVYAENFADCSDVKRILAGLKELGLFVRSGFKADALTGAGLDTETMKPLRLTDSWQLHMDILREVFPSASGAKDTRRGFDIAMIVQADVIDLV